MKRILLLASILGLFLCRASLSETTVNQAISESPRRADLVDIENDFPYGKDAVSRIFEVDFNGALDAVLEQLDKRGISLSEVNRKTGLIRTASFKASKSPFPPNWVCSFDIKLITEKNVTKISIYTPCGNNCEDGVVPVKQSIDKLEWPPCIDGYDAEAKDAIDFLDALNDKFKKMGKADNSSRSK